MYEYLTREMLDLEVEVKGRKASAFAFVISCCSSSSCCGSRGGND
jgi:hypothetical protein